MKKRLYFTLMIFVMSNICFLSNALLHQKESENKENQHIFSIDMRYIHELEKMFHFAMGNYLQIDFHGIKVKDGTSLNIHIINFLETKTPLTDSIKEAWITRFIEKLENPFYTDKEDINTYKKVLYLLCSEYSVSIGERILLKLIELPCYQAVFKLLSTDTRWLEKIKKDIEEILTIQVDQTSKKMYQHFTLQKIRDFVRNGFKVTLFDSLSACMDEKKNKYIWSFRFKSTLTDLLMQYSMILLQSKDYLQNSQVDSYNYIIKCILIDDELPLKIKIFWIIHIMRMKIFFNGDVLSSFPIFDIISLFEKYPDSLFVFPLFFTICLPALLREPAKNFSKLDEMINGVKSNLQALEKYYTFKNRQNERSIVYNKLFEIEKIRENLNKLLWLMVTYDTKCKNTENGIVI